MNRRKLFARLAAMPLGASALLLVAAASGAPGDAYTASVAPALVKPSTSRTYTIQLKNDASSPSRAQRARIGIAAGFVVSGVTATTSAAGTCVVATWIADGTLIADGRINLKRPGGGPPNELCPGATLAVSFTAVAPSSDGTGAWTTELLRTEAFALVGSQPVVRVDGTPPLTTIGSGPADPTNSRSGSFVFSANEAGSTFECKLDAAAFASCNSPVNLSGLADGGHTFRIRATDAAGNVEASPALHSWTVDVTPPDTTIVSGPPSATDSDFASLAFAATEAGSTFECALDDAPFAPCTSPASFTNVSEGAHVFRARATDAAGNTDDSPDVHNWSVDVTAPQTTILGGPANPTNSTTAGFTFSANESGAGFDCRLDGAAFAACVSPATYPGLADGVHVFEVRARDAAGNTDPSPDSHTWTIDTNVPEAVIEDAPFDPSNVSNATFSFSANEAGSAFRCRLAGEPFAQCTSPKSYVNLPDGNHTFEVRAVDTAGNTGAAATHTWSIGTVAPLTTIDSKPDDPTASLSATFMFSSTAAGATFECALDGGAYESCSSPQNYSGLEDGEHRFLVRATEPGSPAGSPAGFAWHVDTVPPGVAIDAAPPVLTNATTAGFAFSATELSATFLCQLDGGGFVTCASPKSYSGLLHGQHTFAVRAVDRAGNESTLASHAWMVDLVSPETTVGTGPPATSNSTSATFAFTSSEPGSTFTCRLDSGSFLSCVTPKTFTSLSDGPHVFEVRATDAVGNTDATPSVREWTVDTTPPETTIDSGPTDPTKSPNGSIAFSSSESGSTFVCRLDGGSFVPCDSPAPLSLNDGAHTFEVRATDDVGNVDPTAAVHTWTVDTTPPDTTILSRPADPTSSGSPAFTFAASEPGSTFECKLDASPFATCSAPAMYSGLTEGSHTFQVRATDEAGNTDATPAPFTWTIDTTPPDTSVTAEPSNPTKSRAASFQFDATEAGSSFECSLDGVSASCSSPVQYLALAEGTHTFDVRATDPAGNTDATPATRTWRIDLTAPQTTIDAGPPARTNERSPSFTFSANETGSTFECKLDGGSFVPCTTPESYTTLAEGQHTFYVVAIDPAGNADATPAERTWTIDLTAPETTIASAPADPTNDPSPSFTFTAGEAGSTFNCGLDGGAFSPCTSPAAYGDLGSGPHTFRVQATDTAGNTDASPAEHAWAIDLTAPETTIDAAPGGPTTSTSASIAFSADQAGATFECRLDGGIFAPCTSPVNLTGLAEGTHTFRVRATDVAANTDPSPAEHVWAIDLTAPQTTIGSPPLSPTNLTSTSIGFSASEPGSTFECSLDAAAFAACTSPATYSALAEGLHTFRVRASDAARNTDGTPGQASWTIDTTSPTTTINSEPPAATKQQDASFAFSSNEAGSTFECKLDNGAFAACTSPRAYGSLAEGAHTFQVYATDPAGNQDGSSATRSWTIDITAPDTAILTAPANPTSATSASFTFSATESGSTFECSLDGVPFAACTTPVSVSSLTAGSHTFAVRATDPVGNTDASAAARTWTIDLTAPQTTIDTGPPATTNERSPSFTFSANESGSTFECSLDAGPFAPCTSPAVYGELAEGGHTFRVRATDPVGNADASAAERTWTIDVTAPQTTIGTAPAALANSASAAFAFSSGEAGSTFQCSLDGAAFAACSSPRNYSGLAEGQHTFRVRAIDPAGNIDGSPADHVWSIDLTAPQTTIDATPENPTNDRAATFRFSASETGATFACKLDGAAFASCSSPKSYAELPDGSHTFSVRATDPAANIDETPSVFTWTIDVTGPQTTIHSGPLDPTSSLTASFSFSASEPGSTFECRLDDASFTACTSPKSYTGLAEGAHTFRVRSTDPTQNTDGSPAAYTWFVDLTPPQTTILSSPSSPTNDPTPSFGFASTEPGSTFECSLDGAAFAACASPKAYPTLADGAHTFQVRARDTAGNVDLTPDSRGWTVDTAMPETTITSSPPDRTASLAATLTFTASEPGSTFECRLDGASFAACVSPLSYANLPEGVHTFRVRATDPAGNVDGSAAIRTWTIDLTPPQTTIVTAPADPTNDRNPTFTFSSDEAGGTFECKLDGGNFAPCTSPKTYSGLGEGTHTFEVRASDVVGNLDASPDTRAWRIDITAPQTTLGSGPADPTNATTASITFSATEVASTFECRLDGIGAFLPCTSPAVFNDLAEGPHTFEVRAKDPAGNVDSSPAADAWRIDLTPPGTNLLSGQPAATNSRSASFTFSASEAGSSFQCSLDGVAFASCSSPTSYSSLSDGPHTFRVRAVDQAGNADGTPAEDTWVIDVAPPDTTIDSGPADPTNDVSPSFTFSSSEPASSFECRLDGGSYVPCPPPATYGGLIAGSHTFEVRAKDAAGNVDSSQDVHTWRIDLTPPETTIASGPPNPTNSANSVFTFSANESGSTFECKIDAQAFSPCTSPTSYHDLTDGPHIFEVRAMDPAGNPDTTPPVHPWTVETGAPTTTITSAPPLAVASTSASFGLAADERVARFECSLDNGAFATCTSPQSYNGLAQGSHSFRARAIDLAGNVGAPTAPRTWTVDTVAPDTVIASGPPATVDNGSATFAFAATEAGVRFECALDGAAFSGCVSPLTLNDLPDGSHTLQVRAWDVVGNVDSTPAAHSWTVARPAPPAPDVPQAAPDRTAPAEVANLRVTAGDGSVALTWRLPGDADLDHVTVRRMTPGKTVRTTVVYNSAGAGVTDRGLTNGLRYRYRLTTHDRAGNASVGVEVAASPQAALYAPARGATLTKAPTLRWKASPGARYYNVQLWRVGKGTQAAATKPVKVLSAWPAKARFQLRTSWRFEGKQLKLVPGRYSWYVWPGLGKRTAERYGPMIGQSSFTVKAKAAATRR